MNFTMSHIYLLFFAALALGNALTSMSSHVYTLKLEQCGLSGRPIMNLCELFFVRVQVLITAQHNNV